METTQSLKERTKNIIDILNEDEILLVYNYAQQIEHRNKEVDIREIKKYRGKLNLDIDLDTLRGRNDPR